MPFEQANQSSMTDACIITESRESEREKNIEGERESERVRKGSAKILTTTHKAEIHFHTHRVCTHCMCQCAFPNSRSNLSTPYQVSGVIRR